jgi:hypothetical protein
MKLSKPGRSIAVSVENITPFGIWLFVKKRILSELQTVSLKTGTHPKLIDKRG